MQPFDFSLAMCEYAWSSFDSPAKMFRQHVSSNGEKKIHPTQKPVELYAWILRNYAKDGDLIFDPMVGSGSSRIAAYKLGFDFYGCEIDKDYFDAQEKRFASECFGETQMSNGETVKQLNLF
jgi:site-specific DNA-methyltransferase (adenine-specific)